MAAYGAVVVGGSVHAGKIQKSVRAFCDRNLETLKGKRRGLFLCRMEEGEKAERPNRGVRAPGACLPRKRK